MIHLVKCIVHLYRATIASTQTLFFYHIINRQRGRYDSITDAQPPKPGADRGRAGLDTNNSWQAQACQELSSQMRRHRDGQ